MSAAEDLLETLGELNPEAVFWPNYEPALIGIGQQFNTYVAVYSYRAMLDVLVERDGCTFEEATEHISYNTLGQYTGPYDPVVLYDKEDL